MARRRPRLRCDRPSNTCPLLCRITLAAHVDRHKHHIYDEQCASNNEALHVLCLRAAGGLCDNTRAFIARCAQDRCFDYPHLLFKEEVRRMQVELSIRLQRFNGECVATGVARHRLDQ